MERVATTVQGVGREAAASGTHIRRCGLCRRPGSSVRSRGALVAPRSGLPNPRMACRPRGPASEPRRGPLPSFERRMESRPSSACSVRFCAGTEGAEPVGRLSSQGNQLGDPRGGCARARDGILLEYVEISMYEVGGSVNPHQVCTRSSDPHCWRIEAPDLAPRSWRPIAVRSRALVTRVGLGRPESLPTGDAWERAIAGDRPSENVVSIHDALLSSSWGASRRRLEPRIESRFLRKAAASPPFARARLDRDELTNFLRDGYRRIPRAGAAATSEARIGSGGFRLRPDQTRSDRRERKPPHPVRSRTCSPESP